MGTVLLVDIRGGIGPATRDYLQRGITQAIDTGAAAVVLRIDTPGGLDASTRDINRAMASEVPVVAWVAPEGARAASAGTYIVYASDRPGGDGAGDFARCGHAGVDGRTNGVAAATGADAATKGR